MATQKQIVQMIAAIKTIYPYYAKEADTKTLVNTWGLLLHDFPDDITEKAFLKALQTCKMPPTPADVIENIKAMVRASEPTDEELWGLFTKTLRMVSDQLYYIKYPMPGIDHRQKITDLWEGLPDKLKQYIGSRGELLRLSDYGDEELKFEKSRFLKTMPMIQTRQEFSGLMIEGGNTKLLNGK